jgi:hypothetical protein
MFQLAFDESGTHDKQIITVAGYVAPAEQWHRFTSEWSNALPPALTPFHASQFFYWIRKHPEGYDLRDRLWGMIRRRVNRGFQVSLSVADYERAVPPHLRSMFGSAYTMCVQECLVQVEAWAEQYGHSGPFAYWLESGHTNINQLVKHLNILKANHHYEKAYRIGSFTLAGKSDFVPLQAADMLAHAVNRFLRSENRSTDVPYYEQLFRETLPEQLTICDEQAIRSMVRTMEETEREWRVSKKRG